MTTTNIDDLTNYQLVTIVVFLLNGDKLYVDREDVAVKANDLAPGRFTWRKHKEMIDLESVSVALRDAKKPSSGVLLAGSNKLGWMVTQNGLDWINELKLDKITNSNSFKTRKEQISSSSTREKLRLRETNAYFLYRENKKDYITIEDFKAFLRYNDYFKTKSIERRIAVIENAVQEDQELNELWLYLKEVYIKEVK